MQTSDEPLISATATPSAFIPDNTPRPCKIEPRRKKRTRGTPGAFGKCKNNPEEMRLTNFLREQGKKLKEELFTIGTAREETREKIDRVFGQGATEMMIKTFLAASRA